MSFRLIQLAAMTPMTTISTFFMSAFTCNLLSDLEPLGEPKSQECDGDSFDDSIAHGFEGTGRSHKGQRFRQWQACFYVAVCVTTCHMKQAGIILTLAVLCGCGTTKDGRETWSGGGTVKKSKPTQPTDGKRTDGQTILDAASRIAAAFIK